LGRIELLPVGGIHLTSERTWFVVYAERGHPQVVSLLRRNRR
jgi:hypothetical protein